MVKLVYISFNIQKMSFKKIFAFTFVMAFAFISFVGVNYVFAGKYDQVSLDGSTYTSDVAKTNIANQGGISTNTTVPGIIGSVIKVILGISGTVALIFIIWGGIQWMISKGDTKKIGDARKLMVSGVIGIFIIAASYAITDFVIKQITVIAG